MDENTKHRLDSIEKRIDDFKTFFVLAVTAGSTLFGIVGLVFAWNANSEKADLREFKKELTAEMRRELGKTQHEPILTLLTMEGNPLQGAEIDARMEDLGEWGFAVRLPFVIKNTGRGWTGPVTVKAYTQGGIVMQEESTDERNYSYEMFWSDTNTGIPDMPGGFTFRYPLNLYPREGQDGAPPPGRHPVLIKFFYGAGKVARAEFTAMVMDQ